MRNRRLFFSCIADRTCSFSYFTSICKDSSPWSYSHKLPPSSLDHYIPFLLFFSAAFRVLVCGVWLFLWEENAILKTNKRRKKSLFLEVEKHSKFCMFFLEKKRIQPCLFWPPRPLLPVSPGLFGWGNRNSLLLSWAKLNWSQNTSELIVESASLKHEMMLQSAQNNHFNSWMAQRHTWCKH